jgi:hypothetical protein
MVTTHWEVSPFVGAGPFRFGMNRGQVRALVRAARVSFKKGPHAQNETDAYPEIGVHFYYDELDQLECLELVEPIDVCFNGITLIGNTLGNLLPRLAELGFSHRFDDGCFIDDAGFVVFAPDDTVKAVTVYRKGYF